MLVRTKCCLSDVEPVTRAHAVHLDTALPTVEVHDGLHNIVGSVFYLSPARVFNRLSGQVT